MNKLTYSIKEIFTEIALHESVKVLQEAYSTVSEKFGFTKEKVPTNTVFITINDLIKLKEHGDMLFGLYHQSSQIGFVAIEKANPSLFYIKKIGVIPKFRNRGYGIILLDFCFEHVKTLGGEKISISIMNENFQLKNWYQKYGFQETSIKEFPHLPFKVCFLEKMVA